ncbi:HupE/UreJ family protein [Paraferrimonas sedimenticola]|uniref:Membrane protein n=1 Tax=Paraferrimonas sedimenticola TaxID=375674 RepID=A0AA37W1B9_9GAMM|nr:HupE/UreJ family protein [Paraferrimonas sedimenticola]GLP96042.1 membrane protein [Paraferrimonas sedimenticola]
MRHLTPFRVIQLLILVGLLGLVFSTPASAHTLGVDKAELSEIAPGEYKLAVTTPAEIAFYLGAPELPERCEFIDSPGGETTASGIRFSFKCLTPLTGNDQFILPWEREGVMLTVKWFEADTVTRLNSRTSDHIVIDLGEFNGASGGVIPAAKRYIKLGTEHILMGLDHLLFVLALLFVVRGGWLLVKTITAFTVAHSITLALATFGLIKLPAEPVEAAIALSIVFMCAELLYARNGRKGLTYRFPWVVSFAFGLLHGLGFAGALMNIGLPQAEIPLALLFFNVGVEIGQLLFVGVCLALAYALRETLNRSKDSRVFINGELTLIYAMGTFATLWTFERVYLVFNPLG